MAEIDTDVERTGWADCCRIGWYRQVKFAEPAIPGYLNELDRLQAENQRLEALIIHDAGGRAVTQGSFNAFMSDYNRVREQRDEMRSQRDSTIDALIVANVKCGHMTDEIESVLQLMDGLAEQWGDEGVFRRCRDRLRALTKEAGE